MQSENFNSKHPELLEGEVFLLNVIESELWLKDKLPHWVDDVRKGEKAYDNNGELVEGYYPLFAKLKPVTTPKPYTYYNYNGFFNKNTKEEDLKLAKRLENLRKLEDDLEKRIKRYKQKKYPHLYPEEKKNKKIDSNLLVLILLSIFAVGFLCSRITEFVLVGVLCAFVALTGWYYRKYDY